MCMSSGARWYYLELLVLPILFFLPSLIMQGARMGLNEAGREGVIPAIMRSFRNSHWLAVEAPVKPKGCDSICS